MRGFSKQVAITIHERRELFTKTFPLTPKKVVFIKSKEQEDEELCQLLLQDRVFVDYFNIFLSLPVFPEQLLYDFKGGHFVCDSSMFILTKTFLICNHVHVLRWVIRNRFPKFFESEIYFEYALCQNLVHSEELLKNTDFKRDGFCMVSKEVIMQHIGHVLGMHKFKEFLNNSSGPGCLIMHIWKELEQFRCMPDCCVSARCRKLREIQEQHFRNEFAGLPKELLEKLDNLLKDGFSLVERKDLLEESTLNPLCEITQQFLSPYFSSKKPKIDELTQIQKLCISILRNFWLAKYIQNINNNHSAVGTHAMDNAWKNYFQPYNRAEALYREWGLDQSYKANVKLSSIIPPCKINSSFSIDNCQFRRVKYIDCPFEAVMISFHYNDISALCQTSKIKSQRTTKTKAKIPETYAYGDESKFLDLFPYKTLKKFCGCWQFVEDHFQDLTKSRPSYQKPTFKQCIGLNLFPIPKINDNMLNKLTVERDQLPGNLPYEWQMDAFKNLELCKRQGFSAENYVNCITKENAFKKAFAESSANSEDCFKMISDRMAGYPFLKSMAHRRGANRLYDICFHHDVFNYFTVRNFPIAESTKAYLKLRKSRLMLIRYGISNQKAQPLLKSVAREDLQYLRVAVMKCDDISLVEEQSNIRRKLQHHFSKYVRAEEGSFNKMIQQSALLTRSECDLFKPIPMKAKCSLSAVDIFKREQLPEFDPSFIPKDPPNMEERFLLRHEHSFQKLKSARSLTDYSFQKWPVGNCSFPKEDFTACARYREHASRLFSYTMCGVPEFTSVSPMETEDIMSLSRLTDKENRLGSLHFVPKAKEKPKYVLSAESCQVVGLKSRVIPKSGMKKRKKKRKHFGELDDIMASLHDEDDDDDEESVNEKVVIQKQKKKNWVRDLVNEEDEENRREDETIETNFNIYTSPLLDDTTIITSSEKDAITMEPFKKPFVYNGRLVHREEDPPESLQEILQKPVHLRFFRRFLQFCDEQTAMHYLHAIDDIRFTADPVKKLQKLENLHTQFFAVGTQKAQIHFKMESNAIKRITEGRNVTFKDYVSVYKKVLDRLENFIFPKYRVTFPNYYRRKKEKASRKTYMDQFLDLPNLDRVDIAGIVQQRRDAVYPDEQVLTDQVSPTLVPKDRQSPRRGALEVTTQGEGFPQYLHLPDTHAHPENDTDPYDILLPGGGLSKEEFLENIFSTAFNLTKYVAKWKSAKMTFKEFFGEEDTRVEVVFTQSTLKGFSFKQVAAEVKEKKRKSVPYSNVRKGTVSRTKQETDAHKSWQRFIMDMVLFHRGMNSQPIREEFRKYLRFEARRVACKIPGHVWGAPLLKRVKGRIVDMMKLHRDADFVTECSIYVNLYDVKDKLAEEGRSVIEEIVWLHRKASVIIDMFFLSDVSPLLQINIDQKTAAKAVYAHISAESNDRRAIFHVAAMTVLPTVAYMWNRFVSYRYGKGFAKYQRALRAELERLKMPLKIPPMELTLNDVVEEDLSAEHTVPFLRFRGFGVTSYKLSPQQRAKMEALELMRNETKTFKSLRFEKRKSSGVRSYRKSVRYERSQRNSIKPQRSQRSSIALNRSQTSSIAFDQSQLGFDRSQRFSIVPHRSNRFSIGFQRIPWHSMFIDNFFLKPTVTTYTKTDSRIELLPEETPKALPSGELKRKLLLSLDAATEKVTKNAAFDPQYVQAFFQKVSDEKDKTIFQKIQAAALPQCRMKQEKVKQLLKRHMQAARKFDLAFAKNSLVPVKPWTSLTDVALQQISKKIKAMLKQVAEEKSQELLRKKSTRFSRRRSRRKLDDSASATQQPSVPPIPVVPRPPAIPEEEPAASKHPPKEAEEGEKPKQDELKEGPSMFGAVPSLDYLPMLKVTGPDLELGSINDYLPFFENESEVVSSIFESLPVTDEDDRLLLKARNDYKKMSDDEKYVEMLRNASYDAVSSNQKPTSKGKGNNDKKGDKETGSHLVHAWLHSNSDNHRHSRPTITSDSIPHNSATVYITPKQSENENANNQLSQKWNLSKPQIPVSKKTSNAPKTQLRNLNKLGVRAAADLDENKTVKKDGLPPIINKNLSQNAKILNRSSNFLGHKKLPQKKTLPPIASKSNKKTANHYGVALQENTSETSNNNNNNQQKNFIQANLSLPHLKATLPNIALKELPRRTEYVEQRISKKETKKKCVQTYRFSLKQVSSPHV